MEGLISEIYGIGRRQIDLRRWRNERISTEAELFLFPWVEEEAIVQSFHVVPQL